MNAPAFTDERRLALIEEAIATDYAASMKIGMIRIALDTGKDAPAETSITTQDITRIVSRFAGEPEPEPDKKRASRRASAAKTIAKAKARNPPRGQGENSEKAKRKHAPQGQTAARLLAELSKGQRTTTELAEALGMQKSAVSGGLDYQMRKGTVVRTAPSTWRLA